MWTRELIKSRAKSVLKVSYMKAFIISLVIMFAGAESTRALNWTYKNDNFKYGINTFWGQNIINFSFQITFLSFILIDLVTIALRVFIGYTLEVGGRRYFVRAAENDINMNYLGYSFSEDRYLNIVKTMFWRSLYNLLWYLVFIIPGFVKGYAYSMVPYILADNPNIECDRAIELSIKMTDGEKMDMFVLDLSFIGWYLLGGLLFGIGTVFVMPYQNATKAELYLALRETALENGTCSYEELGLKEVII